MKRVTGGRRPQNLGHTLECLGVYLKHHSVMLALVALLASLSAIAALIGTYMIRPVVNGLLDNGSLSYLAAGGGLYGGGLSGGALCTLGYSQIMVRAAQKILREIRRDLFAHLQTLPLQFFDTHRKGDLMSLFTNDVDTVSDAPEQQLCPGHPDLCPGGRYADHALCAQLAALAAHCAGLCGDVLVY